MNTSQAPNLERADEERSAMAQLILIIDDIRTIYETVHEMLAHWSREYHAAFISEMLKLNPLEQELQEITGDWDSMHEIIMAIYKKASFPMRTRTNDRRAQAQQCANSFAIIAYPSVSRNRRENESKFHAH
jgi:hypothetical protein